MAPYDDYSPAWRRPAGDVRNTLRAQVLIEEGSRVDLRQQKLREPVLLRKKDPPQQKGFDLESYLRDVFASGDSTR